ncbi:MAG: hypothetical protein J6U20_03820 [Fibrobacter sp.]|nr:hypothetical protein [Fibrobacter sp.]
MKNRLHKSSLKVTGFTIHEGIPILAGLKENRERRYQLASRVRLSIYTNQGTLHVATAAGFVFDGRSGPKIIDWYTPNLGSLEERLCWLVHDANGYGQDLSFGDTNVLLYAMLRDLAGYRKSKATIIQLAVSLTDGWYGEPDESDWCYPNINLVSTMWVPCLR